MSVQVKETKEEQNYYTNNGTNKKFVTAKVNLTDLVNRLKKEKKKERKDNLILSVAACSAVGALCAVLIW